MRPHHAKFVFLFALGAPLLATGAPLAHDAVLLKTRLLAAALINLIFALLAQRIHAVTVSGAVAGALLGFVLYAAAGPAGFTALAAVFLCALISTRLGYERKQRLGAAENKRGRKAWQVLANVGVATLLVALAALGPHSEVLLLAASAAFAEAAADTVSSECGKALSDNVYLITTFKRVAVGSDGGISLPGSVCGVLAALFVAAICHAVGLLAAQQIVPVMIAAVLGSMVDSLLGATLERRRILNNHGVNFISTAVAAALTVLMWW